MIDQKASLGTNEKSSAVDWEKDKIIILNKKLQHKKIELELKEDVGVGEYELWKQKTRIEKSAKNTLSINKKEKTR